MIVHTQHDSTTVQPRLSGTAIIRTLSCRANVYVRMRRGRGRSHLVGLAIAERRRWARWSAGNDKRRHFYESFGGLFEVKMSFYTKAY